LLRVTMQTKRQKRVPTPTHYPREGRASTQQAAQFLNLHPETIRRRVRAGRLPGRIDGTRLRINWEDLWTYRETV
jgi:excisionase family DNA binding protein